MKITIITVLVLFMMNPIHGQLRKVENNAFKKGEQLVYRLHYGFIDAGEAVLEVKDEEKKYGERSALHVVGVAQSKGAFDWFFKVRDRYESYIDEESVCPWVFVRRVDEGGYKINQNYVFNPYKKTVNADGKPFNTSQYAQDMISSFYYARIIDFSNAKPGDIFSFDACVENEIYPLKIKYVGKETIKTDIGYVKCIKFHPVVQKGRVFKHEEDLTAWITDDKNHIPIRAEADILVGSIKMDLKSYKGLANPMVLVK